MAILVTSQAASQNCCFKVVSVSEAFVKGFVEFKESAGGHAPVGDGWSSRADVFSVSGSFREGEGVVVLFREVSSRHD